MLRKHGHEIAEMQYTQKRVADMAIDLYAIAGVSLAHDPRHRAARRRGRAPRDRPHDASSWLRPRGVSTRHVRSFDKNDDELRKSVASSHLRRRGIPVRYPLTPRPTLFLSHGDGGSREAGIAWLGRHGRDTSVERPAAGPRDEQEARGQKLRPFRSRLVQNCPETDFRQ